MTAADFLPTFDIVERHSTRIAAPRDRVYASLRRADFTDAPLIRWLFRLRGLPVRRGPSFDQLSRAGFIVLADHAPDALVLGIVGRFWTAGGCLQSVDADGFRAFDRPGFAKAAWDFT